MNTPCLLAQALARANFDFFFRQAVSILNPGRIYREAPHLEVMCEMLQRVWKGELNRSMITVPPRYGKSSCVSVAFAAWALGHDPTMKILVASYGQDLAAKHARDFRTLLESDWYRALFPKVRISPRRNTETELQTTMGGGRRAVSLGGAVTGLGADLIIIDDLMKSLDASSPLERQRVKDYYEQTLYSRLDDKRTGKIIVIQQRLHEDDFVGYLLDKDEGFYHLNLPAIAMKDETLPLLRGREFVRRVGDPLYPELEPLEELERTRRSVGNTTFDTQWQQDPTTSGADFLRADHFQTYSPELTKEHTPYIIQAWDTALAAGPMNDYSVCMTAGYHPPTDSWLLLNLLRIRKEYAELLGIANAMALSWRPDTVVIEESGTGRAMAQALWAKGIKACSIPSRDSKEERLVAGTPIIREGRFRLPQAAPWRDELLAEIRKFPMGKHDDQVDALSLLLAIIRMPNMIAKVKSKVSGGRSRRKLVRRP